MILGVEIMKRDRSPCWDSATFACVRVAASERQQLTNHEMLILPQIAALVPSSEFCSVRPWQVCPQGGGGGQWGPLASSSSLAPWMGGFSPLRVFILMRRL